MDEVKLASMVVTGKHLFLSKLFMTSMHCLWAYDYLLTFGDEIKYAWSGKKSRIFMLFIALRYTPVLYILWFNIATFRYSKSLCKETKWAMILYTTVVTCLAQAAITLRVYAVTGRNKFLGGFFSAMVTLLFLFAIYYLVRSAMSSYQQFPEVGLNIYKMCAFKRWRPAELVITVEAITFDVLAFTAILVAAKGQGTRHPSVPSLLDAILRDATLYFVLMFACQLSLLLFLFLAPEQIQILPAAAESILISIMAPRLMLSLKRASIEPGGPWSLNTMSDIGTGGSQEGTAIRFASPMVFETPETTNQSTLGEEDIEVGSVSQSVQNHAVGEISVDTRVPRAYQHIHGRRPP